MGTASPRHLRSPIQNSPGIFDDKMIVIDASHHGSNEGTRSPCSLTWIERPSSCMTRRCIASMNCLIRSGGRLLPTRSMLVKHRIAPIW